MADRRTAAPTIARTITLAYDASSGRFGGTLTAPSAAVCASERRVTLWKQLPGGDRAAGNTVTAGNGRYSLDAPKDGGTYYAHADGETIAGVVDCETATSQQVDNCDAIPACNPDDDGDGVLDVDDACPSIPSATAIGCPRVTGSMDLVYVKRHEHFSGRLRYPLAPACLARHTVTLWKQRRKHDAKLATATSRRSGSFRIAIRAKKGRYYAKGRNAVAPGSALCARTESRWIEVR